MKRIFGLVILFLLPLAVAGSVETDQESGITFYILSSSSYSGDDMLSIFCYDVARFNDAALANNLQEAKEYATTLETTFGVNTVLYCQASHIAGEPYFWPLDFTYVTGGFQYDLGYDDYIEVNGSAGQLRPNASVGVFVVIREVERGQPFTLYYDDDSVEITLENLPF